MAENERETIEVAHKEAGVTREKGGVKIVGGDPLDLDAGPVVVGGGPRVVPEDVNPDKSGVEVA